MKPLQNQKWKWDGDDLWHVGEEYSDKDNPHTYLGIQSDDRLKESKSFQEVKNLIVNLPTMYKAILEIATDNSLTRNEMKYLAEQTVGLINEKRQ